MTIASEITRLQWAKSDIKTSIENKGVAVPSSTKLDDYAPYIDQISTGWAFMDSLTLKEYRVEVTDWTPWCYGVISWSTNTKYYWAMIIYTETGSSSWHEYSYYDLVTVTKEAWSDIQYGKASHHSFYRSMHWRPNEAVFYIKPWAVRAFFYEIADYSTNWVFWFQADWNTETNEMSVVNFTRNQSTVLPPEADTTGYTETTINTWIKSVTGTNTNDDSNIYLTLK